MWAGGACRTAGRPRPAEGEAAGRIRAVPEGRERDWEVLSRHTEGRRTRKKEYVRGKAHTNTVEGYFSLLKRGLIGTYHHVGAQHLQRYVSEFDFRYNNRSITDLERSANALKSIEGKRLTYRRINGAA